MSRQRSLLLLLALTGALLGVWLEGSKPRKLGEYGQQLQRAQASPDGLWVAGLHQEGPERWSLTTWDTRSGKPAWPPQPVAHPPATTRPLAWSPDGRWLALGCKDEVVLIEASSGRRTRLAASWLVREVRFSGDWLLARADGQLFLWQASSGRLLRRIAQESVLSADIQFEQKILAAQSLDGPVRLYEMPGGRPLGPLPGGGAATDLRFVCNGEWLLAGFRFRSGRHQDRVQVMDWRQGKVLQQLSEPDMAGWDACADGSRVVTRSPRGMTVWNGQSGQPILRSERPGLLCEAFSPDGKRLLALATNGSDVTVLESDSGRELALLPQPNPPQSFRFFRPGGGEILNGSCSLWTLP